MPAQDERGAYEKILDQAGHRLDFHDNRYLAFRDPHRARDVLVNYASLDLTVIQAKGLPNEDTISESDAYAEVYINDSLKATTKYVSNTSSPVWNWSGSLPITSPYATILIQVKDYDWTSGDACLGFVEFPIADVAVGKAVRGWFHLLPKEKLSGYSPERLEELKGSALKDKANGAVLLELTLRIASGNSNDEWYAACLPEPTWVAYPDNGPAPKHLRWNAQATYDQCYAINTALVDDLLGPCLGCVSYVFTWREILLSFTLMVIWLAVCAFPNYFACAGFASAGMLLLLLASSSRRRAMGVHAGNASLSDAGYEAVASLQSTDQATRFLERVVKVMDGRVLDRERLADFAAFSMKHGLPVTSYRDLKVQLRAAADISDPFLRFNQDPMPEGSRVYYNGVKAEVLKCLNPSAAAGSRLYKIALLPEVSVTQRARKPTSIWSYLSCTPEPPLDKGGKEYQVIDKVLDDELEVSVNLEFMNSSTVRLLVPDFVENTFGDLQPTLDVTAKSLSSFAKTAHEIVSWKRCCTALSITLSMFLLSAVCAFVEHFQYSVTFAIAHCVISILLMMFVLLTFGSCIWCRRYSTASSFVHQHVEKDLSSWPFFEAEP